ncbi:SigE family RNA polymerase sigma factor [Allorhizocola rhizosphaerae]|uniref:SigE family RNA polymerase sigma factor n=1 Tax=Allorhizocola rhizosphaerae TaxID=1872709 RepID=UPI000E3EC811|nr:SigE family RNA polymerase sigma factor [Allorhizocola rhizosphaerae]
MAEADFREFVEARYAKLLRIAFLLVGDPDEAEDVLQTALLAVLPRWRTMDHPEAYVRAAMVNHLIGRWRRRRVIEVLTGVLPERPTAGPGTDLENRDELWRALQALPGQMRAVLVLRYWEDLSEAETASLLRCSVGTVKSQASRGLARLRQMIEPPRRAHPALLAVLAGDTE